MKKLLSTIAGIVLPMSAFALVYQYDPAARLAHIQINNQGGVHQVFSYCQSKYRLKSKALADLGVNLSPKDAAQNEYQFMATCIYGKEAYKAANCGYGGVACQKVVLPIDWPTIESDLKSMKSRRVSASYSAPSSIY